MKAASTRALAPVFESLAQEFYNDNGREDHRAAQRVALCLVRLYDIMQDGGLFLGPEELSEFRRVLRRFGASHMLLASRTSGNEWNIVPKAHLTQHLGDQAGIMNPRWCWNYSEESQIGSTTMVWEKSAAGRYRPTVQKMVLIKRVVALAVRLESRISE